ncbi:MAG: hypothetical protein JWO53_471 [Chlamydiia bacterium]|nr:hypothetical protein [Chlamydiia bacterium]
MKKIILGAFFGVLIAVSSLIVYGYANRVELLTKALTLAIGVPVQIQEIDLTKQGAVIRGLKIHNPHGCKLPHALIAEKITITLNWIRLLEHMVNFRKLKLTIDSIHIDAPIMGLELFNPTGSDNNWSRMFASSADAPESSASIDLMIDEFLMTHVKLKVEYHCFTEASLRPQPIARIELKNIGSNTDVGMKQLFQVISKVLLNEAASSLNLKTLLPAFIIQRFIPIPLYQAEQAGQFIKNYFDKKRSKDNSSDDE